MEEEHVRAEKGKKGKRESPPGPRSTEIKS
jgi:hypothetical protein